MQGGKHSVVVTGAGGFLAAAVITRCVAEGWRVIAVDAAERRLERVRDAYTKEQIETAAVDLTEVDAVDAFFDAVLGGVSQAPLLVAHLVGGFAYAPLAETDDDTWRQQQEVNLDTSFLVLRACARAFAGGRRGSVVAVGSPHALRTPAGVGAYAAAKAGVLRLVEGLAAELPRGARANAVLPFTMDTPANRKAMPDVDPATWVTTEEVAEAIVFLLSDRARGISGAFLEVGRE
ncbi:MAG TPA: SDR family oxidoreductase [Thermoanaerobaculia bacterium]|nr:SDR family oxidoreductase [Thermoanaerobaculia bacterium]